MNQPGGQREAASETGDPVDLASPINGNLADPRKRLLIVDDEHLIADTVATILSLNGFDVWTAYSGEEAVGLAAAVGPHLLISDVMMPGINGVQTAMRVLDKNPGCRVILFSGHVETTDHLRAARFRGHSFLAIKKPLHPVRLIRLVVDMLALEVSQHANHVRNQVVSA